MKVKLSEIANIHFGPYLKSVDSGEAKYLLASHFDKLYQLTKFDLSFTDISEKRQRDVLQPNDVILAGKGQRTFAWAYNKQHGPCVPSSLFFVLRMDHKIVIGKYLASYLNSEPIQHKLKQISGGLTIPSIPKKELEKMDVSIPSIEEQKRFIELAELLEQDIALTETLLSKKKAMRKTIVNKMIKNQTK